MEKVCIGILRETKDPPDRRVSLSPAQCRKLMDEHRGLKILVQPSHLRCFSDEEYRAEGIELNEDLSSCQVLMGVKEVKIPAFKWLEQSVDQMKPELKRMMSPNELLKIGATLGGLK